MGTIKTNLGKIYCKYNDEKEDYDKYRLIKIEDGKYHIRDLIDNHLSDNEDTIYTKEEFKTFISDSIQLRSAGIISITNVLALSQEEYTSEIRDIIAIFFKNIKDENDPESDSIEVVARQGINNIFADMAGVERVGLSVTYDTLPEGYEFSDIMAHEKVIDSYMTHVYMTDNSKDLATILDNINTTNIFNDLYDRRRFYLKNVFPNREISAYEDKYCIDGYCTNLATFFEESDFITDVRLTIGIGTFPTKLENNKPLNEDEKDLLCAIFGGIHVLKAVPLKFSYDINMDLVRMKYVLVMDNTNTLYIVPYTEEVNEVSVSYVYDLNEERTTKIHDKLVETVKAYQDSKKD